MNSYNDGFLSSNFIVRKFSYLSVFDMFAFLVWKRSIHIVLLILVCGDMWLLIPQPMNGIGMEDVYA
jgi:hypothetical protein